MRKFITIFLVTLFLFLSSRVASEEDKFDETLKKQRQEAEQRNLEADVNSMKQDLLKRLKEERAKEKQKKDFSEFKLNTLDNLGLIKEMFAKAEEAWKNQKFNEGGLLYQSVSGATVPGSEEMATTSRGRLIELEDIAKAHLIAADDADIKRDFVREIKELNFINKELIITKTREIAIRRLIALRSRSEVEAYIELDEAESLEADGKKEAALKKYKNLAENPRYENTVPALKAKKKLKLN